MRITDRYASAVNASNLKSVPDTRMSDSDVLGAYAIADRRLSAGIDQFDKHPLAVPLERLFTGDSTAGRVITRILHEIIMGKAKAMRLRLAQSQGWDMARAVLAWYRANACRACGGHGFMIIPGTVTLGDRRCEPCEGTGKIQLVPLFRPEHADLVRWVMAEVEREAGRAGVEAMRALSPRLEL